MKIKHKTIVWFFALFLCSSTFAQSNWEHVGPRSTNKQGGNLFETSQLNFIEINPYNANHLTCGGKFAGLWYSTNNGANWTPIETSSITGTNGVNTVCYLNSNEIFFANFFYRGHNIDYSTGVWKYNFATAQFTALGALPNPNNYEFTIQYVTKHPQYDNILFVCTSIGLYRSTDSGLNWVKITDNFSENIVFVPVESDYHCFVGGSSQIVPNSGGDLMIKRSTDDGATFTDISANFSVPSDYANWGHCILAVKPSTLIGVDSKLFVCHLANVPNEKTYLHSVGISNTSGNITYGASTFLPNAIGLRYPTSPSSIGRLGFEYSSYSNGLWFGGVKLSYYNLDNNTVILGWGTWPLNFNDSHSLNGNIHDDIHYVKCVNNKIYVACDGGINIANDVSSVDGNSVYFEPINNGLHVALLNGFSGTDDNPSLYAIQQQDIINLDIFESNGGAYTPKVTKEFWEADGPIIDKFDQNFIIADKSSYGHSYGCYPSINQGITWGGLKTLKLPVPNSSVFEVGASDIGEGEFDHRIFYQDPYRPGRIFRLKNFTGIHQWVNDPVNNNINTNNSAFVQKVWPGHLTNLGINAWNKPTAMSFSPETKNSMHITFSGLAATLYDPACPPAVIKYIGPDIDDTWRDHNGQFATVNGSTVPQWENITSPAIWSSLGISGTQQNEMIIHSIETSPWNKNVVYIGVFIPGNDAIQVLKYDGSTWSNYSSGLPLGCKTTSMIMDRQSNDAIYISCEKGVYYRSATDNQWSHYSNNLPRIFTPQMEINYVENTVRAGTWGRGIWKSGLNCPALPLTKVNCNNCNASVPNYYWEGTTVSISSTIISTAKRIVRGSEYILMTPGSTFTLLTPNGNTDNYFLGYIHGCGPTTPNSFKLSEMVDDDENNLSAYLYLKDLEKDVITIYPNPSNGIVNFDLSSKNSNGDVLIKIYDITGKLVESETVSSEKMVAYNLSQYGKGLYLVTINYDGKVENHKVIIE
jgi:hypothetical protein